MAGVRRSRARGAAVRTRRFPILFDTLRALRPSVLVWFFGGGVALFGMGVAIATEREDFPGGPKALAVSVAASAEALRALRWPAERLDTLGGYVTYHNVILVNLFLVIYGTVQGARAVRGGEESHSLEEVLATGVSRVRVVLGRTLGFALAVGVIVVGLALGVAAGLEVGGDTDLPGALVTLAASGLAALVGFGLGLLLAQLTAGARAAAAASAAVVTALYVVTNVGDELGPLAFLQNVSPFTYVNYSRALVPGYGFDLPAMAVLLAMAAALVSAAAWAFVRRDYASPLWARRRATTPTHRAGEAGTPRIPTAMLGSVPTATLRRGWVGTLSWALGAAVLTSVMAALQPTAMEVWSAFDVLGAIGPGESAADTYWSFTGALVTPLIAAYVVSQASGWVDDLVQGRVETVLAGPVSWSQLVRGRLLALAGGVLVISGTGLGALTAVGTAVGARPDTAGLGRTAVTALVFGAALGAVAAILVAWLRLRSAVTMLAVVVGASYVLAYLAPLLGWPEWLNRLSVFWAFGQPYLQWPPTGGLVVLLTLALPGAAAAAAIAERTAKTA